MGHPSSKLHIGVVAVPVCNLPLAVKLPDDVFWGQIQIDLRCGQPVMPQDILQGSGGDALLNTRDGKRMSQHVGRDGSADMRSVGDLLDHPLDRSDANL